MSEGTTLSFESSAPVSHVRSSIGSVGKMAPTNRNSIPKDDRDRDCRHSGSMARRDSANGTTTASRAARTSLSRVDTVKSPMAPAARNHQSAKLTAMARMEQRGGSSTNIGGTGTAGSTAGSTTASTTSATESFTMRHSHYKEGIRLAEMGDWPVLMRRLPEEPQLARHKDHHGMLPLHWACTEDDAGPAVVAALLDAFPEGVLTRNNAQYLPIHIAVRANLPLDTIRLLCEARPSSLLEETPLGKTPLMLAIESNINPDTINLLRRIQHNYEDPSEDNDDDRTIEDAKREIEVQSHLLRESMMLASSGALRSHSNAGSTLSVGRLQSNSVLGSFPSEARSSTHWTRENNLSSHSNHSHHSNFGNGSRPQLPPSTTGSSQSGSSTQSSAVVRYMDTLMRERAATAMIDEESDASVSGHGVGDDETTTQQSHSTQSQNQPATRNTHVFPASTSLPSRPTHLRATEGDLSNFNSGVCGVCYKKFSMFRKKYQCKSCWMVVCKKHVAAKVDLPGQTKKRSVCADCYILHRDGNNVLPSVPSSSHSNSTFSNTHTGTYNLSSTAIVPTRNTRAESTPGLYKPTNNQNNQNNAGRISALSTASDMRHTMATVPSSSSRPSTVRFAPTSDEIDNNQSLVQKPQRGSVLDRFGSDTTASLTETDRNSSEVATLHHRIGTLEDQNKMLLSRLADQEKQYDDCMLLLTQTMTRVAEIEMRVPGLRLAAGSERESEAELNPASFDFGYPLAPGYGIK